MIADDLSRIAMSSNLEQALSRAAEYARAQAHASVALEHMLLALCEDEDAGLVLAASNVDVARLRTDVSGYLGRLEERAPQDPGTAPVISADLRRILEAADAAAKGGKRREINGAIVLAAIVGDGKSAAAHMLRAQGLTFEDAIRALQRGAVAAPSGQPGSASADDILASARQRVQTRAAPTLRNIKGDQIGAPSTVAKPAEPVQKRVEPKRPVKDASILVSRPSPARQPAQPENASEVGFTEEDKGPLKENRPSPPVESKPPQPTPETKSAPPQPKAPVGPAGSAPPPIPSKQAAPGSWTPPPGAAGGGARPIPTRLPPSMPPPPPGAPPSQSARPGPPPLAPWPEMDEVSSGPSPSPGAPGRTPSPEAVANNLGLPPRTIPGPPPPSSSRSTLRPAPRTDIGQLVENIPRSMRVDVPVLTEVRIARSDVKALAEGLQGGGAAYKHEVTVTKAMSVRLRAPDGGFFIETASPETQWIEKTLLLSSDDFASWRWNVTPRERGRKRLLLIISARTVSADGLAAETALPDQIITVRVKTNYAKSATRWAGWAVAAIVGGLMARFGEGIFEVGRTALTSLTSG